MADSSNTQKLWNIASSLLIFLLCAEVGMLILQNRKLQNNLSQMSSPQARGQSFKEGDIAQPVNLLSMDGSTEELNYKDPSKKRLVFVFSTTCPHCEATFPKWQSFAEQNQKLWINPIGICTGKLEETRQFIMTKKPKFPVYSQTDTSFARKYKIIGVPQTMLIGANGRVEKIWVGELKPETISEINGILGVPLAIANQP